MEGSANIKLAGYELRWIFSVSWCCFACHPDLFTKSMRTVARAWRLPARFLISPFTSGLTRVSTRRRRPSST